MRITRKKIGEKRRRNGVGVVSDLRREVRLN
jgi:hypothetical protein